MKAGLRYEDISISYESQLTFAFWYNFGKSCVSCSRHKQDFSSTGPSVIEIEDLIWQQVVQYVCSFHGSELANFICLEKV